MYIFQVKPNHDLYESLATAYYRNFLWAPNVKKFSELLTDDFEYRKNNQNKVEQKAAMIHRLKNEHFNTLKKAVEAPISNDELFSYSKYTFSQNSLTANIKYTATHIINGKEIKAELEHTDTFFFEVENFLMKIKSINSKTTCTPLNYEQEELAELRKNQLANNNN